MWVWDHLCESIVPETQLLQHLQVIQKLFEHGTQVQKTVLANTMEGHVLMLSLQMYGCHVVHHISRGTGGLIPAMHSSSSTVNWWICMCSLLLQHPSHLGPHCLYMMIWDWAHMHILADWQVLAKFAQFQQDSMFILYRVCIDCHATALLLHAHNRVICPLHI